MTKSPFTWIAVAGAIGAMLGMADHWLGLSYGIELLVTGLGVLVVLNLSHRYAGVPS